MKLVYLAPSDLQVARVDRQCIVSFCSALARRGVDVELVAIAIDPLAEEPTASDPLALYPIRDRFRLRTVRVPVAQTSGRRWLAANRLFVHSLVAAGVTRHASAVDPVVFYTKTYSTACVVLALRRLAPRRVRLVFEAHVPPVNAMQRLVLASADRVVANSYALATELATRRLVERRRLLGVHQGVDLELVESLRSSKQEARAELGYSTETKLVVYTGKIYDGYREVELLLEAARMLEGRPEIEFLLVGGRADHVARLRERIACERRSNVRLAGFVPPADVRAYQFAADVLVLYYPSGLELNDYRSPGKLFEYMAARRPIVAVDLPVLREVLGERDAAVFVPPDSPQLLAGAIFDLLDDGPRADAIAAAARARVERYTWDERARLVLEFLRPEGAAGAARAEAVAG